MEQSQSLDVLSSPQEKRWLVENFASRAALLGFIYVCVNIIYQQGYLSRLGFEFGLFTISRTLPLLFDNFLIAAYSFIAWGFIVEVTPSTYDQLFGFFNPISWRDHKVTRFRIIAIVGISIFYLCLHTLYLARNNQIVLSSLNWTNITSSFLAFNVVDFWAFLIKLLIPTWNFINWWPSFLSVLALLILFGIPNRHYRTVRNLGLYQLLREKRRFLFSQINLVTPAYSILAGFFSLVMLPGFVGSETAYLTIKNIHAGGYQQVERIELVDVTSFCGESVLRVEDQIIWERTRSDQFTFHLLGSIGEYDLFIKVVDRVKTRNVNFIPNDSVNYVSCLVASGVAKSIIYSENSFQ